MALSLDAPIEELKLSNRVRNVLHLSGLHTIGSLLECDYKTALRRFGPEARAELASALESQGFTPPINLCPSESDDFSDDVSKLVEQMEACFQKWSARIEYFEMRIRELSAKGRKHRRSDSSAWGPAEQGRAMAQEFKSRLAAMRAVGAALGDATKLPVEQGRTAADVWRTRLNHGSDDRHLHG